MAADPHRAPLLTAPSAHILGSGVAAFTLARLLAGQGWGIRLEAAGGVSRPMHVLLSQQTATLLATFWDDPALLAGAHAITEQAVEWNGAALKSEPGVVISSTTLAERLAERLYLPPPVDIPCTWTIDARPGAAALQRHGMRHAWVAPAVLHAGTPEARSRIMRADSGWLFLLPLGAGRASLQWTGLEPPVDGSMLGLAAEIAELGEWSQALPAMPRSHPSPAVPGRLMAGEAALGFDPLSGEGVAHALRGVLLAATTLATLAAGAHEAEALARYAGTLKNAMGHHLGLCLGFYEGFDGPGWQQEIAAMQAGYLMANTS